MDVGARLVLHYPDIQFAKMLSSRTQRKAERQSVSKKYFSVNCFSSLIIFIQAERDIIPESIKQQLIYLS